MDKADVYIECIHCDEFFTCTLKQTKTTDLCVNFVERKDRNGKSRLDTSVSSDSRM